MVFGILPRHVFGIVALILSLAPVTLAQQTGTGPVAPYWLGGAGSWNDPAMWSQSPRNTVHIDKNNPLPSTVTLQGSAAAPAAAGVYGLFLTPGDTLLLDHATLSIGDGGTDIAGTLHLRNGGTLAAGPDVGFGNGARLVIDGSGALDVNGRILLTAPDDALDVLPRPDRLPYDAQLIATYAQTLHGVFNTVTPGITVDYSVPGQIRISGTPIPEPASLAPLAAAATLLTRRRRHR